MRLLYVEDNRINALLFEEIVATLGGFDLRIAEDAAEALRVAGTWHPQVLVLDAHLPDMSGITLLGHLRELPALASVPAFMCSADAQPDDLNQAREAGFIGYWAKPVDVQRILADLAALHPPADANADASKKP